MTEKEIMKGLECCIPNYTKNCKECPYEPYMPRCISVHCCDDKMRQDVFNLLLEKNAEIDRLKGATDERKQAQCKE